MTSKRAPATAEAYHHLYSGKTLLIKVSGRELQSEHFPALIQDIRDLARHSVKFIIICGAGEQNTQHLKTHFAQTGKQCGKLERVGGRRKTDWEQLQYGVLPAHQEIREMFRRILPEATLLDPEHIHCRRLTELDFVGDPEQIEGLDSSNIVVLLSVGSDGEHRLNINADDTARVAAAQEKDRLNEVFFITETGGVLHDEKIVPLIWAEDIAQNGTHSRIDVTGGGGGMQKKILEARKILQWVPKVVITDMVSIRKEIERVLGSGTMIVSRKAIICDSLRTNEEEAIFLSLYERHVRNGDFRPRTDEELRILKKHIYLLKVSNSVLGAFALIPRGEWMELATICSEYNGTGVGDVLIQKAQQQLLSNKQEKMYALASSHRSSTLLMRHGFEDLGNISILQKKHPNDCPPCVMSYDTSHRDPFFCTWHKEIPMPESPHRAKERLAIEN